MAARLFIGGELDRHTDFIQEDGPVDKHPKLILVYLWDESQKEYHVKRTHRSFRSLQMKLDDREAAAVNMLESILLDLRAGNMLCTKWPQYLRHPVEERVPGDLSAPAEFEIRFFLKDVR